MEIIYIVGRIIFGGFFLLNGINHFKHSGSMIGYAAAKGIPRPGVAVYVSGLLLVLAGLGLVADVYITYSLLAALLFLVPTTFTMHTFWKETDNNLRMNEQVNFMKNMALIGAVLMML